MVMVLEVKLRMEQRSVFRFMRMGRGGQKSDMAGNEWT
jgi:hypothetical protein